MCAKKKWSKLLHCIKLARIPVFSDPYITVWRHNRPYTGKYGPQTTRILACFTQCFITDKENIIIENKISVRRYGSQKIFNQFDQKS